MSPTAANQVAADFAARVAATLNTSSDSGTKQGTIAVVTAPIVDTSAADITTTVPVSVNNSLSSAPVPQGGDGCQQGTPAPVNSIKKDETKSSLPSAPLGAQRGEPVATIKTFVSEDIAEKIASSSPKFGSALSED